MRRLALSVLVIVGLGLSASESEARRVFGAKIPDPSDPAGDQPGHFVVRKSFMQVVREVKRTYERSPGIIIHRLVTPPRINAYYIENTRRGRTWDGINLYEYRAKKTVFMTVLPAQNEKTTK